MNSQDGLILDTHIWIWWVNQDNKLSDALRTRIGQTQRIAISSASIYELVQLVERGRLTLAIELLVWLRAATLEANIDVIAIDSQVAQTAAELPPVHGDPLDRFIIATAITSALSLVSLDRRFADYSNLSELLIAR